MSHSDQYLASALLNSPAFILSGSSTRMFELPLAAGRVKALCNGGNKTLVTYTAGHFSSVSTTRKIWQLWRGQLQLGELQSMDFHSPCRTVALLCSRGQLGNCLSVGWSWAKQISSGASLPHLHLNHGCFLSACSLHCVDLAARLVQSCMVYPR